MSEKRKIQRFNLDEGRIWEAIEGLSPYKTTYTLEEVCELLNEQQATIRKLQDLCGESDGENAKLRIENKRLEEENGHFKKELKRFKDWINSDKYDYELTLSFIKNKGYSLQDVLEYEKELKE